MVNLFTPITLGDYVLPNRIFMAPLTRARSLEGAVPNADLKSEYYSQRASAGLIIAEATAVSPIGLGWINTCGIWNEEQQFAWAKVTEEVHKKGGRIFLQLWHMGAIVPSDFIDGEQAVSASEVLLNAELRTPKGRHQSIEIPKSLTITEIKSVQQEYVEAANRAILAGFDGVEIHAANGFLIDQFTRDGTNKRVDEYGGTVDNRIRFCLEIVEQICARIGSGKVGIRISPTNKVWGIEDSNHRATFTRLVERLNDFNLAYLHILEPHPDSGHPLETIDFMTPLIRKIYKNNYIINGGYTKESGNKALQKGVGDAIAFGLPFISNPDLVERFMVNAPLADPNPDTFYTNDAKGYIDYPRMD
ncbi:MAG: alkene reductase [Neptuniibacter sp.]